MSLALTTTVLGYNEATRNLNFRIECESLLELKECVRIINRYNEFSDDVIIPRLAELDLKTGGTLTYSIGREGSPCMYIRMMFGGSGERITNAIEEFAKATLADECDLVSVNEYRLWWD